MKAGGASSAITYRVVLEGSDIAPGGANDHKTLDSLSNAGKLITD